MKRRIKKSQCDNCGVHFLKDVNFCYNCGQENHVPNQPIKHLFIEFFESLFHFDTKFFFSFHQLVRKPGLMTYDYNRNKRGRYVPPVRLYVFVSAIFFLIVGFFLNRNIDEKMDNSNQVGDEGIQFTIKGVKLTASTELEVLKKLNDHQIDSALMANNPGKKVGWIEKRIFKQIIKFSNSNKTFIKGLTNYTIKYTSIILFLLMPLYAFFLWLYFLRYKRNYYEYLIFSIQYHTVSFALLSIMLLLGIYVHPGWLVLFSGILLFYYLYKSLKINFGLSSIQTFLCATIISTLYSLVLLLTVAMSLLLGFMNV
ncbi:MAG: DUF3667 domain-containing protein [Saprospiraceae bacterium]|nr:DUF3667 domain-containing protein [Saprospiraceae bacterium]